MNYVVQMKKYNGTIYYKVHSQKKHLTLIEQSGTIYSYDFFAEIFLAAIIIISRECSIHDLNFCLSMKPFSIPNAILNFPMQLMIVIVRDCKKKKKSYICQNQVNKFSVLFSVKKNKKFSVLSISFLEEKQMQNLNN